MVRIAAVIAVVFATFAGPAARAADAPDLTSPKKAAIEFARGVETGNFEAVKAASVGKDDDYAMIKSVMSLIQARQKLREAAIDKFGDEGKQMAEERGEMSKMVEGWDEKIDGDNATVTKTGDEPWKLLKSDGGWKVDLAAMPHHQKMTDAMQKVIADATADIASGKYKTLEEAKQEVTNKIFAVVKEQMAPPSEGEKK